MPLDLLYAQILRPEYFGGGISAVPSVLNSKFSLVVLRELPRLTTSSMLRQLPNRIVRKIERLLLHLTNDRSAKLLPRWRKSSTFESRSVPSR